MKQQELPKLQRGLTFAERGGHGRSFMSYPRITTVLHRASWRASALTGA